MNKRETEECLKRAQECARQADAALDPELKIYLMKLALSWTQAAGETVERELRGPRPAVSHLKLVAIERCLLASVSNPGPWLGFARPTSKRDTTEGQRTADAPALTRLLVRADEV
jgi:hypothetical protein